MYIEGPAGPPGPKGEPGTLSAETLAAISKVFVTKDLNELQQSTLAHGEGSLAFVMNEQSLLVRTSNSWQYIMVIWCRFDQQIFNCFICL